MRIDRVVNLSSLGPGLLFAAVSVGLSHLVQSTRAGAMYGLALFFGGLAIDDKKRWEEIVTSLKNGAPESAFEDKELALLNYAREVTLNPGAITEQTIHKIRAAGADDGEILEVNQISGYFSYANRTVLGLGITEDGEYFDEASI